MLCVSSSQLSPNPHKDSLIPSLHDREDPQVEWVQKICASAWSGGESCPKRTPPLPLPRASGGCTFV